MSAVQYATKPKLALPSRPAPGPAPAPAPEVPKEPNRDPAPVVEPTPAPKVTPTVPPATDPGPDPKALSKVELEMLAGQQALKEHAAHMALVRPVDPGPQNVIMNQDRTFIPNMNQVANKVSDL